MNEKRISLLVSLEKGFILIIATLFWVTGFLVASIGAVYCYILELANEKKPLFRAKLYILVVESLIKFRRQSISEINAVEGRSYPVYQSISITMRYLSPIIFQT